MALQLPLQTEFGFQIPTAYAKASGFRGGRGVFLITVDFYASAAARDAGTPVVTTKEYQWDVNNDDLLTSFYTHLKTLEDFTSATDC
jgi:hypothetical protein